MKKTVAFSPPDIGEAEIEEVIKVLKSGWITTGPKTKEFEKEIAQYCGTKKAVCLNSATACMELILRFFGVGEGDEVITSAYTYSASASVIYHVGATPILIDVAPDSYEMDYEQLSAAITPKTKAIIPVDIAGLMCNYDRISSIVNEKKNLFNPTTPMQEALGRVCILADAAHSFGAVSNGKKSGQAADFTAFSFHAVKNITTAEGGAITWNEIDNQDSDEIYKQFMLLSLHGQSKDALAKSESGSWEYDIIAPWYKCNMTDIMAALGLAQLRRYDSILERRHQIIAHYDAALSDLPLQTLRHKSDNYRSSGHLYLVRLIGRDSIHRNKVIERMAKKGVACNVHYKPLPMHTAYKKLDFDINDFPNAHEMYKNEITLPLHTLLTDDDIEYVIRSMIESIKE